jgi:drug/metabolite transporter (DMT)-like permease
VPVTAVALGLILIAAVCHAAWNLVTKRVAGGPAFALVFTSMSTVLYAPIAVAALLIVRPRLTGEAWLFVAGNGILHLSYLLALLRAYRAGDLSVVYPVARGTGPMLAALAAIVLLGERPTPLAYGGIALIGIGVFSLAGAGGQAEGGDGSISEEGPRGGAHSSGAGVGWGLVTGGVIAAYTVWDKHAVSALALPALFYDWAGGVVLTIGLLPFAARRRDEVRAVWSDHRREALVVAVLSPLAYILVLTALASSPVSYVAPAREVSILIGAMLGARLLGEGHLRRRIPAAIAIVVGVVALAIA